MIEVVEILHGPVNSQEQSQFETCLMSSFSEKEGFWNICEAPDWIKMRIDERHLKTHSPTGAARGADVYKPGQCDGVIERSEE